MINSGTQAALVLLVIFAELEPTPGAPPPLDPRAPTYFVRRSDGAAQHSPTLSDSPVIVEPVVDWNPNNRVDGGSIPSYHEFLFLLLLYHYEEVVTSSHFSSADLALSTSEPRLRSTGLECSEGK